MASAAPTHMITYLPTGTIAEVQLAERIHVLLDRGEPLEPRDKRYVAMRFKNTTPIRGHDLSREYVDFKDLNIQRMPMRPDFDDEPVRMGPGGVVLMDDDDDEPEGCDFEGCCTQCGIGYHSRCATGRCPLG